MGMYPTKYLNEDSLKLDTKWLKDHGYFCGWKKGGIIWEDEWSGHDSSISFIVDTDFENPNIRLLYKTNIGLENEKNMDYSFPLIKVPCNLGGFRWAFKCQLYYKGVYCGRTVYTLYSTNLDYFGCRHCMRIVYRSQRECRRSLEYFGKIISCDEKLDKLYESTKKRYYKGKLTKKMQLINKLERIMYANEPMVNRDVLEIQNLLSKKQI